MTGVGRNRILAALLLGLGLLLGLPALVGATGLTDSTGYSAMTDRVAEAPTETPSETPPNAPTKATSDTSLSTRDAVILGAVEGITEYLPVSSTGHLLVTERLLGIGAGADKDATDTYTVVIQIGAIFAVLGIFWKRFLSMAEGLVGRSEDGRNSLIAIVVAFIPAGIIGKLFGDSVKQHLLSPTPVAITWIIGGFVILVFVAQQSKLVARIDSVAGIGVRNAAIIGVAQTLALMPGTSRSLVTILAAMLLGVNMATAVEFSFLLGFVTLSAATALELVQHGGALFDRFGVASPLVGVVVAGITAFASVKFMIDWLNKRGLALFGWYRIVVGLVTIGLVLGGRI